MTSATPASRICSALMTLAPIGLKAGSLAKREAVTTTGANVMSVAAGTWASVSAARMEKTETSASDGRAPAPLRNTEEVMMCFRLGTSGLRPRKPDSTEGPDRNRKQQ
ncbi:MAG TPA: hypothetical protein VL051_09925 [Burkholderiaceae bacterium]|nr:hypothetical protein [Burkholderiaceae bacterium]